MNRKVKTLDERDFPSDDRSIERTFHSESEEISGYSAKHVPRNFLCLLLLCVFVIVSRIGALAMLGPVDQFDTDGYIIYSDLILGDHRWLHYADLKNPLARAPTKHPEIADKSAITTVRLIGYPALLALSKLIAPSDLRFIICGLQIALASLAYCLLYVAARRMGIPDIIALPSILLYSVSFPLIFDISIMTDSIFSNIIIITISLMTIMVTNKNKPYNSVHVFNAVSFMFLVLLREVGYYMVFFLGVFTFLIKYLNARSITRALLFSVLIIAPSLIVIQAYRSWNSHRSGERFTTLLSTTMLRPLVALELSGVPALDSDANLQLALDDIKGTETAFGPCQPRTAPNFFDIPANKKLHSLAWRCMGAMEERLLKYYNLNYVGIGQAARSALIRTVIRHPLALLRYQLSEMITSTAMNIVTFDQVLALFSTSDPTRLISLRSLLRKFHSEHFNAILAMRIFSEIVSRSVSMVLFVVFFVFMPVLIMLPSGRKILPEMAIRALPIHLIISLVLLFGHSTIHIEPRYFMAAQAFVILDGIFVPSLVFNATLRKSYGLKSLVLMCFPPPHPRKGPKVPSS